MNDKPVLKIGTVVYDYTSNYQSDENKGFAFVKCCERNKNYIYLTYDDNLFNIDDESGMMSSNIEYCPWCGVLLDTNLLES